MARQFKTVYELESESSGRDAVPCWKMGFDTDGGSLISGIGILTL